MRRWSKPWLKAGISLILLCVGIIVFGLAEAVRPPTVRRAIVVISGWPQTAPTVRVALLADIHLGNRAMTTARLRSIVAQVNEARPDIVVIAGDFITGHEAEGADERVSLLSEPLASLRAPLGVIAVLGNHDYWTAPDAIRNALRKAGITVLENTAIRRGPLAIIGVGDAFSGHDDVAKAMTSVSRIGGFPIVLTHAGSEP